MAETIDTTRAPTKRFPRSDDAQLEEGRAAQQDELTERLAKRSDERGKAIDAIERGDFVDANPKELVAQRLDRLSRYYAGEDLPQTADEMPKADPDEVIEAALERSAKTRMPADAQEAAQEALDKPTEECLDKMLEKVILTPDFVGVRYLDAGVAAARAVGRVNIRNDAGRVVGYGTGSLISPRLLLTNHHVLPDEDSAAASAIEFNYQDGLDGQPLQSRLLSFDPDTFFIADQDLDFALVAVRASERELAEYGFNPIIEAQGKAFKGDFVTIIQHPRGEKKQVVLRENQIVDEVDAFLHYAADTEPGSSGSPVFNDQWEMVALHHAGVPAPDHPELGSIVNEGIRASQLLKFIRAQPLDSAQKAMVNELRVVRRRSRRRPAARPNGELVDGAPGDVTPPATAEAPPLVASTDDGVVRLTVPLEVTLRLGAPGAPAQASTIEAPEEPPAPDEPELPAAGEAIKIDPDYEKRKGFDEAFLGSGARRTPLPKLSKAMLAEAATMKANGGKATHVLPYHHYSVVLNKERRLAFFTAVNIDGERIVRVKREPDRWFLDPRIPAEQQTGEAVYVDNKLDRGHLVRRLDPAWGDTPAQVKIANDDTFHFTNCTPQHMDFNEKKTSWAGLEDYVLNNADTLGFKVNVFTGPVFSKNDKEYRGVRLPKQFWKVVVALKKNGGLSATAYLLSQSKLLSDLEAAVVEEEFSYGAYKTFQVPVARIEELTGLSFGALADADPLGRQEATAEPRELERESDLII